MRRLAVLLALVLFASSAVAAPAPLRKPPKKEADKPAKVLVEWINLADVEVGGGGIVIAWGNLAPLQIQPPPPPQAPRPGGS